MTWRVDGDGEGRDFGRERVFVNVCVGGGGWWWLRGEVRWMVTGGVRWMA